MSLHARAQGCLIAAYLFTFGGSAHAEGRIRIGQSDRGVVFWCGNELEPPYVVSADSAWNLFVNGLPLVVPDIRSSANLPTRVTQIPWSDLMSRDSILVDARREAEVMLSSGARRDDAVRHIAERLNQERSVVDTAYVSGSSVVSTLRGSKSRDVYIPFASGSHPSRDSLARQSARETLALLDKGAMMLFGPHATSIIPRSRIPEYRLEIDSIRVGNLSRRPPFSSPMLIELLRHPAPLPSTER